MPAYELFSSTELLGRLAMEKMLAGLSTGRYGPVGLEPVGEQLIAHLQEHHEVTAPAP